MAWRSITSSILVYAKPEATPAERHAMWQEMERMYLPWRDYGDLPHVAERRLLAVPAAHLSQPVLLHRLHARPNLRLQFWVASQQDFAGRIAAYVALCRRGGEAAVSRTRPRRGLISPFDAGCLRDVVAERGSAGSVRVISRADGVTIVGRSRAPVIHAFLDGARLRPTTTLATARRYDKTKQPPGEPPMKAAYIETTGPAEKFKYGELPDPSGDRFTRARENCRGGGEPDRYLPPQRGELLGAAQAVHHWLRYGGDSGFRRREGDTI